MERESMNGSDISKKDNTVADSNISMEVSQETITPDSSQEMTSVKTAKNDGNASHNTMEAQAALATTTPSL